MTRSPETSWPDKPSRRGLFALLGGTAIAAVVPEVLTEPLRYNAAGLARLQTAATLVNEETFFVDVPALMTTYIDPAIMEMLFGVPNLDARPLRLPGYKGASDNGG
jgi:hypothetical protein